MRRNVFALSSLLVTLPVCVGAERLPIKTYSVADGLGHNTVNRIVRDSRGLLWFCTADGLSRFDGYTFTNFGVDQGLPYGAVNDVLETRHGEYWVASNGGLVRFDPEGTSMFSRPVTDDRGRDARSVTVLREARDGTIWVGTHGDLFRLSPAHNPRSLELVDIGMPSDAPDQRFVEDVLEDSRGALWIAAASGLYRRWVDGSAARYGDREGLPKTDIHSLLEDHTGHLWVGTHLDGFFRITADATHRVPVVDRTSTYHLHDPDGLPTSWVYRLFETSDRRFWAATARGLVEFFPDADERHRFRTYTARNGLSDYEITALAEDRAGNLWLGTIQSGAMRIRRGGFIIYGKEDGIQSVTAIFEDRAGDLGLKGIVLGDEWTSVFEGAALNLLRKDEASLHTRFGTFDGQRFEWFRPAAVINELGWVHEKVTLRARDGEWWVGTGDGVYRFPASDHFGGIKAARARALYTTRDGLTAPQVFRLFEDSRGNVWISTISAIARGLAVWDRARGLVRDLAGSPALPSLQNNLPRAFGEDSAGNVWIGLTHGLVRTAGGRFATFTERDGLPARPIVEICRDRAGRLWLATEGGGLVRVDDPGGARPTFVGFTTAQGLSSNDVEVMAEDANGLLLVGGGHGLDRIEPSSGRVQHFSTSDGLPVGTIKAAFLDHHGVMWIGTSGGLARVASEQAIAAPPVFITGLRVAGITRRISALGVRDLTLPPLGPEQNQLQIDFAAFGADAADSLHYEYRLQGADDRWASPGDQRTVTYARLPPGRYRFEVRTMNADGIAGNLPATLAFSIPSAIWMRWWFLTTLGIMTAALVNALYRRRLARLLEIANMRTRIATDLHDDIGANLTRIALLSELARRRSGGGPGGDEDGSIAAIARIARESVGSMGDIVWAINPARDSLLDLVRRMRQHADELFTLRGVELHFNTPESPESLKLGVDVRRDLLLIFKEAVNNAARHSQCSRVHLDLRVEGSRLVLSVADNGIGFPPTAGHDGQGLTSMSRRAHRLRGTLDVTSSTTGGTTVTVSFPI